MNMALMQTLELRKAVLNPWIGKDGQKTHTFNDVLQGLSTKVPRMLVLLNTVLVMFLIKPWIFFLILMFEMIDRN